MNKYILYSLIGIALIIVFISTCDPPKVDKKAVRKENKVADKVIKKELGKRASWKADSLELVRLADSTRISNTQLKELIKLKKNEKPVNPVYHTDSEFDGFFAKRYSKKGLLR